MPVGTSVPAARHEARGSVLGLVIPADPDRPAALQMLQVTAADLSAAIGGGLLEEALTAESEAGSYTFYVDEHRVAKGLLANDRAGVLSARLGHVNRAWLADLCGDVLVLGCDRRLEDVSVPRFVVAAAIQSGLLTKPAELG